VFVFHGGEDSKNYILTFMFNNVENEITYRLYLHLYSILKNVICELYYALSSLNYFI